MKHTGIIYYTAHGEIFEFVSEDELDTLTEDEFEEYLSILNRCIKMKKPAIDKLMLNDYVEVRDTLFNKFDQGRWIV